MRITNTQKKELSDIFRELELDIFDFETTGQHKEFKVKYKHEYYSFSINYQKRDNYYVTILPIYDTKGLSVNCNWVQTKTRFKDWAKGIALEISTPTGWETFENNNYLDTDLNDLDERFSETDKVLVRRGLKELKERFIQLELPIGKLKTIDKKLDDLDKKVDELSKFDWKSLLIGTIANLILVLAIPTDFNGVIWEYVRSAFNNFRISK
jgi:hypothetical protein